ncbi:hypothetical protein B0H16DRAFT_1595189 [Mycena metata]|uniref:RRM domain-containing protein n=1 Tax=Mycena metata TaxID=1033252 RepID=A0AAD7HP10_9AGAR|nr:hypothetical protein B0H16DRAFT_1595189 [Mycena metata]
MKIYARTMRPTLCTSFSPQLFFLGRRWGSPKFYSSRLPSPSWPSIRPSDTLPKELSDEQSPVARIPWEFRDSDTGAAPNPDDSPDDTWPKESSDEKRIPWAHRDSNDWTAPSPRAYPQIQSPEPPDPLRRHTVCIENVSWETPISDVLDVVQFGDVYHIQDSIRRDSQGKPHRGIAITFTNVNAALGFYSDATNINLYGRRLQVEWGEGPRPFTDLGRSRAITITDRGHLGTEQDLRDYLEAFGPIDKLSLMREKDQDRAFVNFLSVNSGARAAQALRDAGAQVESVPERCWVAERLKAFALANKSRTVVLRNIPSDATLSDVCDQIRGGSIFRIGTIPESGLAYIHFIEHSSAVSFYRHALYNGVMVKNRRLHVAFQAQSKEIPRFLHDEIDRGLTRCLAIEGILNADMLKNDCLHYGNVERIAFSETKSIVSFTAVPHALKASRLLPTKLAYQGLKITFAPDPCAAPSEEEWRKAAALQAEISALLIPSDTQQQKSNAAIPPNRIKM